MKREVMRLVLKALEDISEPLSDETPITARILKWRLLELELLIENEWIHEVKTV